MSQGKETYGVNLLRPRTGGMRDEVAVIVAVLAGWGGVTLGSQLLALFCKRGPAGVTLFGLPLHFFCTAQFLPLWFIVLCFLFNVRLDRLAMKHSRNRDRSHE